MKSKLDTEIDALFQLPLAEFTGARNTLAARLKKEGRGNDAERVKMLTKPPISVWAVNQLYWEHPDDFNELIAAGKRLRATQSSRQGGKVAGMRDSLDARRDVLSRLSDLAEELLRDAGHNPGPDTLRRITTTLEAMSSSSDGPTPGRLTQDLDPPSFESLASLMSGMSAAKRVEEPPPSRSSGSKPLTLVSAPQRKTATIDDERKARQAKIATAKVSLQVAKKSLNAARAKAQSLESTQKKANAEAKEAEKQRREAEELLKKATAASDEAARRAKETAAAVDEASQAVEDAKRSVDKATSELESLLRD
jgi:hypothetical protein